MHSDKLEQEIARVVQSVNEWDDRTSPDDYPEHLLITSEELADILRNFSEAAIPMGIELTASFVEKRLHDYVSEHGFTDPDTGTVEYPGNGEEYVYELEEIIEGIRELASPAPAAFLPTEDGEFNGNTHDDSIATTSGTNADACRAPLCDCSMGATERCGRPGGAADPARTTIGGDHG